MSDDDVVIETPTESSIQVNKNIFQFFNITYPTTYIITNNEIYIFDDHPSRNSTNAKCIIL